MRKRRFLCIAALACGCRSAAPPAPTSPLPPEVALSVEHWAGSPLSGPTGAALPDGAFADALDVRVAFFALDALPATEGLPIDDLARLVVVPDGEQPLVAAPVLARGARVAILEDADAFAVRVLSGELGRAASLGTLEAALPRGVTACLRAAQSTDRAAAILARRASTGIEIVLDLDAGAPTGCELVVLDPRSESSSPKLALAFSSPFAGGDSRAIVATVDVRRTPRDAAAHAAAVARCRADVARPVPVPQTAPQIPVATPTDLPKLCEALADVTTRRTTLAYLAIAADAPAAADVALVGTETIVSELADVACSGPADVATLAWTLESNGLRLLAEAAAGETRRPDIESVLTRRAGQAAREPLDLRELVEHARDRADLERRLVDFNLDALEDPSPAARLRAFEWLDGKGRAPADYDPFGTPQERRAALERNLDASESRQP